MMNKKNMNSWGVDDPIDDSIIPYDNFSYRSI